jgi:hypothetical protein
MSEAQTIQVRVQVVDVHPSTLELVLPAFLPAGDLSQRIARDAGLEAFTEDGRRRTFWLRARGRVLEDKETLADLKIIRHELLHLLPEPPAGSGVVEQAGITAEGVVPEATPRIVMALAWPVLWAFFWGLALTVDRQWWATLIPGLALGMLCVSMAKRVIPVAGRDVKLLLMAMGLCALLIPLALVPAIYLGQGAGTVLVEASPGIIAAVLGTVIGWLAWWTPIEALPERTRQDSGIASAAEEVLAACGLCGVAVEKAVQKACPYSCGKLFHKGCYQARLSAAGSSEDECGLCGADLA